MKYDFSKFTETKTGVPVRNIEFNSIPNFWLGQVWDATREKWLSCSWKKSGKCNNPLLPYLDLR